MSDLTVYAYLHSHPQSQQVDVTLKVTRHAKTTSTLKIKIKDAWQADPCI